jgi:hypothetical protein
MEILSQSKTLDSVSPRIVSLGMMLGASLETSQDLLRSPEPSASMLFHFTSWGFGKDLIERRQCLTFNMEFSAWL